MISSVRIRNFKSIHDLAFEAKRVNVFIGEPNAGKSNILEALAVFSLGTSQEFQEILRFKASADLFFDQKINHELVVQAGVWKFSLRFKANSFQAEFWEGQVQKCSFAMNHAGVTTWAGVPQIPIRYYIFKSMGVFQNGQPGVLNGPFGDNLVAVLYSNEDLRKRVGSIIRSKGFRLQLKPTENELLIAKDMHDDLYSYPWTSVSETLRRVVFYMAALESNHDAMLLLDEPESNTFPFYTKYLAERIALDETNQFMIATHNPYLLSSIVEKTPAKDVSVHVVSMEKFETRLKLIPENKLPELLELDSDAFFNLDKLVGE